MGRGEWWFAALIEFLGFSAPERAAAGGIRDAIYFGLMTASNEESAEEARKALHSKATESAYTVIEGSIAGDASTSALAHFMGPSRISAERRGELVKMGLRAFVGGAGSARRF
jgi:hypothetical protein